MILYYNTETGEATHQHPCDEAYRLLFKQKRNSILKKRGQPEEAIDESMDSIQMALNNNNNN